nr:Domain X [Ipomoea trifida]
MKEAIRMVLESIYDSEFPDTSHFRSGRGCHSVLRRIKEEWGTSRWFLEFDIRKCFHTIDRHRLIPIFKEEIDDPKFFYPIHKVFSAGRLVGGEKGPYSVPHSVLLSALPGNIYLHKLDQEIGRIRQKYEIPIVQRIRSVLLRTGRIDDQENSGEEASFNAPQDNRAIIVGRKTPFVFPPSSALAAFLNKPSSLLCAAFLIEAAGFTPKAEFYGRERCNNNWAMIDFFKYCKRKGLLIELAGGDTSYQVRERPGPINNNSCTEYGRIPRYGHSGSPSEDDSHTILARAGEASTADEGDERNIPSTGRGSTSGDSWNSWNKKSPSRSKVPSDVQQAVSRSGMRARKFALYTPAGRKAAGEGGGHWARSISSEFPIQIEAPIKKILRRLRDRGLISRRRPWPIHVACLTNVSDGDIVNWSAGIAISPLSYYRCRDNLYQVRTIVDYQIRWSAIFTPAHKHKSSARNIILKYSKDSHIVNQEGGKTLAEFSNSIELGKLGSGQDPNNKEHSTTSLV